jgi:hypothetical protein
MPTVRDHFQFAKTGTAITFHGPVKWFHKHSFKDFSPLVFGYEDPGPSLKELLFYTALTATLTLSALSLFYKYYFLPKLLQ